jgi:hypothetical protein
MNYQICTDHAVIVDVQATRTIRQAKIGFVRDRKAIRLLLITALAMDPA